jgi:hypothetical protein
MIGGQAKKKPQTNGLGLNPSFEEMEETTGAMLGVTTKTSIAWFEL